MRINNAELFPVEFPQQCILRHPLLPWKRLGGVSGRGNERKIRLTFSSSSHQYSWLNSVPTDQLAPLKGMGWKLQAGVYARGNSDPGCLWILMELSLIKLFFLPITWIILFCSPISSERRLLFPFFRWRHFVFLGLDHLVGVTWKLYG